MTEQDLGVECDLFERVQREMQVSRWKEIYSREDLIGGGLVTAEEYDSIHASTERADNFERMPDEAFLRHQVVGAEID